MKLVDLKNGDSWGMIPRAINALNDAMRQLQNGRPGPGLARAADGMIYVPQRQNEPVRQAASSIFCAKITANDPAYTFAEVTYVDSAWTVKSGGKTGTAINIAEVAAENVEKIPVDSIVEVQIFTYGGTKYYIISRDIGGGSGEEPPALADLIELASTQGTRDEDYWRADLGLADLAYNIDNITLAAKLTQLLNVGGFVGASVTLTDGPAPADVTIEFVGAWDTVPLLVATGSLTGTPDVTISQVDSTHQKIDFGGNVTGGTFSLTMGEYTFEVIDWNVTNENLQLIISGMLSENEYSGDVSVSGGPCPGSVTIEFEDAEVPLMTAVNSLTGDVTVAVTQIDTTHQKVDFGGTITGGTFDLLMPGHGQDQPILVRYLTDHKYDKSNQKMTYLTRNEITRNGKTTFIGPESDPETLVTTAVVHPT
ncbi:MAG: hypothetical protein ABFD54_05985 [Armatimonadota bacterium]|nr:hypothetical protein [bacterium]